MKRSILIIATIVILIGGILSGFSIYKSFFLKKSGLEITSKQDSGLIDFYIEDEKVYIVGGVRVKNNSNERKKFTLTAESYVDYKSGLLKSPILTGFNKELNSTVFSINKNEEKTYTVVFVGDYGGYPQKYNRLVPPISICLE